MKLFMLFFAAVFTLQAHASEVTKVLVIGDRVSVRTLPSVDGKLIDRATLGSEWTYIDKTDGWVGVQAPDSLDYWVYGESVKENTVQTDTLYVRSSPQRLKSTHVCAIEKGDTITIRDEANGWLKIAPPASCQLWISANYVEIINQATDNTIPLLASLSLVADDTKTQGIDENVSGILRRNTSGLYKLTKKHNGSEQTICLVSGEEVKMERFLNHVMTIKGKKYWAKEVLHPIVQLDVLQLGSKTKS